MQRPRQEADNATRGLPPATRDGVQGVTCAGRIDLDGRLVVPPSRGLRDYAGLFSPDERERGLPAELMRLARRHGCVRDQVLRSDGNGQLRMQRISLQSLHDEDGRLIGFVEMLEGAG